MARIRKPRVDSNDEVSYSHVDEQSYKPKRLSEQERLDIKKMAQKIIKNARRES